MTSDGVDTVSDGETYLAFPFEIAMPDETDEAPPKVTLRIDNVDRSIVQALREASGEPPLISMSVITASAPDDIEAGPFEFTLREATYDALTVSGALQFEDVLNEPFPADIYTPARFKGLF